MSVWFSPETCHSHDSSAWIAGDGCFLRFYLIHSSCTTSHVHTISTSHLLIRPRRLGGLEEPADEEEACARWDCPWREAWFSPVISAPCNDREFVGRLVETAHVSWVILNVAGRGGCSVWAVRGRNVLQEAACLLYTLYLLFYTGTCIIIYKVFCVSLRCRLFSPSNTTGSRIIHAMFLCFLCLFHQSNW